VVWQETGRHLTDRSRTHQACAFFFHLDDNCHAASRRKFAAALAAAFFHRET